MIAAFRRLWRGVPGWVTRRVDVAGRWANDTHGGD